MDITEATRSYEEWAGARAPQVAADLAYKHQQMAKGAFPFLRSTFYRWAQLWTEGCCAQVADAPVVLAVGDLHVENFGTWRDAESRLVWGVNDFDEAALLPFTNDLVRLGTSAALVLAEDHSALRLRDACDALLDGYTAGLATGGHPYVLEEQHPWLRSIALSRLRDPVAFWKKLDSLPRVNRDAMPEDAIEAIDGLMPAPGLSLEFVHRRAGLGNLGRQRWAGIAEWCGCRVVREAKALLPPACRWADPRDQDERLAYQDVLDRAVRAVDPFVRLVPPWVVRRLSPDCSRIDLQALGSHVDKRRLFYAMGWETANVHLGSPAAIAAVQADLAARPATWLRRAVQHMRDLVVEEQQVWKNSAKAKPVGPPAD